MIENWLVDWNIGYVFGVDGVGIVFSLGENVMDFVSG